MTETSGMLLESTPQLRRRVLAALRQGAATRAELTDRVHGPAGRHDGRTREGKAWMAATLAVAEAIGDLEARGEVVRVRVWDRSPWWMLPGHAAALAAEVAEGIAEAEWARLTAGLPDPDFPP
jgi:hypothetical protein